VLLAYFVKISKSRGSLVQFIKVQRNELIVFKNAQHKRKRCLRFQKTIHPHRELKNLCNLHFMVYCMVIFPGYPQPVYRWLKDGVPVGDYTSSQYYRIHNTRKEDAGSYQCLAKNEAGTIFSEKIDIVVAYMSIFEEANERYVSVESGHSAVLDMSFIESVPPPSVSWQTEDGPLNYDIKYAFTSRNQLIILSADEDDQKSYRARAINTQLGKEENSAFIRLNVTGDPNVEVAPKIIVHPESKKLVRGQQIYELQCITNARPLHEIETLWLKDGIIIDNSGIQYTLNDPWNRTLALLGLNLTHTGQYTCQATLRSGGYETVTSTASIQVQEPPTFYAPFKTDTLGDYGSILSLPCSKFFLLLNKHNPLIPYFPGTIGKPMPHVTWFKNAEAIDSTNKRYEVFTPFLGVCHKC
jgi:protein sidekick